MGRDNLILGYPWFAAHDPRPNWAAGMLSEEVELRTAGAMRVRPTSLLPEPKPQAIIGQDGPLVSITSTRVAQMQLELLLEEGNELYMRLAKTTTAQQLAENAADKTTRNWDEIVPPQYHHHTHVFSNEAAQRFPESHEWDHAIELKPDAPGSLDCKIYPLTLTEDIAM